MVSIRILKRYMIEELEYYECEGDECDCNGDSYLMIDPRTGEETIFHFCPTHAKQYGFRPRISIEEEHQ
jgi:hypothetical protein